MGDNRLPGKSKDSREFGPVDIDRIIGNCKFRFYPSWETFRNYRLAGAKRRKIYLRRREERGENLSLSEERPAKKAAILLSWFVLFFIR